MASTVWQSGKFCKLHLCLGGGSPRMVVVPCGDSQPCGPSRTSPRRWPRPHMDNAWLLSECCLSCSTRIHWLPRSCLEFGRRGTVPARLASLHRVNAIPTLKNSVSQGQKRSQGRRPVWCMDNFFLMYRSTVKCEIARATGQNCRASVV